MNSKLVLIFLVGAALIYGYLQYKPTEITAPKIVSANSFFIVKSNKNGDWLVDGAKAYIKDGKKLFVLSGNTDIKIIYSPGLIVKIVKINTPLDSFTLKILSWAPSNGRKIVAASLETIALNFDGDDLNDFIKLTRLNNKILIDSEWKSFFQNLAKYCEENMMEADLEAHKELWIKISEALRCNEDYS